MLYVLAATFLAGAIFGIAAVRYGMGLGTKLYVRARNNEALDETVPGILQEHT